MLLTGSAVKAYEHRSDQERDAFAQARPEVADPGISSAERLAANVGNQAFGVIAREGAGILPDGTAHPDVTAAIARRRGSGSPLDESMRGGFESSLGQSLDDVRVHTDGEADSLARSVSARAFTTGTDIYFAQGEFQPSSSQGRQLIAHEVAHVVQQRGAPTSGPMRVSQPGEPLEQEAEAASRELD
jgi:hypothetical protein